MCGSFLTIKDNVVYVIHQSAMDFLSSNEYLFSSDNMKGDQHRTIFLRSLQALSRGLRRDIYSLNAPGLLVDQISPPDPDPLASIRYSCIYWIDHLRDSYMHPAETTRDDMDLRNDGAVHDFFKKKYIYWPEALSLLGSLSTAGLTILKLEALIEGYTEAEKLKEFLGDAHRFIPLVFSPTRSLVRMQFEKEEPDWMTTLEGDTSRIFKSADISADGKRVVSLSPGGVVRIWDAATGAYMHPFDGYGGGSILSIAMSADGKRVP
ncbi:hypothetical protein CDD83_8003 [Cordyceps sp. RAO-2017]|nr:hypothetical protein CDD83_8003 [Cordyceps sp. RAO-2017]